MDTALHKSIRPTWIAQMGLNSYTFTDSDMSFFQKAREVFADHADCMEFWKLDVTNENQALEGLSRTPTT